MKIEAESQNLGAFLKFRRISEIEALSQNLGGCLKSRRPSYAPIRKLGAQTLRLLTIWARQNLQLLTSSKSG